MNRSNESTGKRFRQFCERFAQVLYLKNSTISSRTGGDMAQVAIVGAGPTGITLAYLLSQQGIEVALIESAPDFDRVFRGEGLMPGGLQALEQIGLLHELLQQIPTQQIHTWEFMVNDRTMIHANEPESLGIYRTTIIPQPAFLQTVLAKAQAFSCFHFIHGTVQGLVQENASGNGDRVNGVVVRQGEQTMTIPATLVIGADGRGSTVRRLANLSLTKLDYDNDVLWFRMAAPLPDRYRHTFYGFLRGTETLGAYTSWDHSIKFAYLLPRGAHFHNSSHTLQQDWKTIDWPSRLAAIVPDWLATHIQTHADTLEPPVLLKVVFGRCPQWHKPGVLLLGDAAHPMAPIRAQGINVAFRDVIVAANHLTCLLQAHATPEAIDNTLATIQAKREPEIIRCQTLQHHEQAQSALVVQSPLLQRLLTLTAPLLRPVIEKQWLNRQQPLRFGLQPIELQI